MPLQSETIPNKNLTGREILDCAVADFKAMLERDCTFNPGVAYRRVGYTLEATFHLGYPHQPVKVSVHTRAEPSGVVEGRVPLNPAPPEGEGIVLGLERDVKLDNPNLARVHHDLPIKTQERMPPKPITYENTVPGEPPPAALDPFPEVKNREFRYDKTQYPPLEPPVDRDTSDKRALEIGARPRPRTDGKERAK